MNTNTPTPHPPHSGRILGLSESGVIWLCYALHGLSIFCGGLTALPAIIINYIKRSDAEKGREGPLTLSHMRWQIRTFWLSLLLTLVCALLTLLLVVSVAGSLLVYPLWLVLFVWYVYRLIKGALALNSGREVS